MNDELKDKISEYLHNELNYVYCYNCEGNSTKKEICEDCHRKYQNWQLSKYTVTRLSTEIIKIYEEFNKV